MNETPSQYYYDSLTLPHSDDYVQLDLDKNFGHDKYVNATSLHEVYPIDPQFFRREERPHYQYYDDQSTQRHLNCPPLSYLGEDSYNSTSSADHIQYEANAHVIQNDSQLNKDNSYNLCYLETNRNNREFKELQEFNDRQVFKENQYYQQTHIPHQNQEYNETESIEHSVHVYQQYQDIEQYDTVYPPNGVFKQTGRSQQNEAIEQLTEKLVPQLQKYTDNKPSDMIPLNIKENIILKTNKEVKEGKTNHFCVPCARVFSKALYLTQHNNAVHGDSVKWQHKCKKCGKKFASDDKLKAHFSKHDEKSLFCIICGKGFNYKNDLKRHMYNHSKKPLSCSICSKEFVRNDHLLNHLESHTKRINQKKK